MELDDFALSLVLLGASIGLVVGWICGRYASRNGAS
jgi:hypothetical protein